MTIAPYIPRKTLIRRGLAPAAVLLAGIVGYTVHAARAGIPSSNALVYAGTLTDGSGAPLTDEHSVEIGVYDAETLGVLMCPVTLNATLTPDASGGFRMQLDDACAAAVEQESDLWLEVKVDGAPLARSKLGAVPFAIEAKNAQRAINANDSALLEGSPASAFAAASHAHAWNALTGIPSGFSDGVDDGTVVPPKAIMNAYLSSGDVSSGFSGTGLGNAGGPYAGWAICNGNNGTPNLSNRFVRINVAGSGATGGNDSLAHTHGIDHDHGAVTASTESAHTHSTPAHQHLLPIGFDSGALYFSASGFYPVYGSTVVTAAERQAMAWTQSWGSGGARLGYTDNSGAATTGPGSAHNHSVDLPAFSGTTGAASVSDNRPSYFELVAIMRL